GSANKVLAQRVSNCLKLPLSKLEIFIFPDGERRVRVLDNVVDQHCVIIQPTSRPVDQNYVELFFIIDCLKRSGASFVTAVVPYLGYQRQDHVFRDGEAVSLEVISKALEATGLNKLITFDLHTIKTPDIFSIEFVHLSALRIFSEIIKKQKEIHQNSILISPDMGGIRRIKILSNYLNNMPFATINKNRDLETGSVEATDIEGIEKQSNFNSALIVDDMISSGGTVIAAADLLIKNGIKNIYVFGTHPVFSQQAPALLQNSAIKKVFVTDGIKIDKAK